VNTDRSTEKFPANINTERFGVRDEGAGAEDVRENRSEEITTPTPSGRGETHRCNATL